MSNRLIGCEISLVSQHFCRSLIGWRLNKAIGLRVSFEQGFNSLTQNCVAVGSLFEIGWTRSAWGNASAA
jgi:hypothetical protein